MKHLGKFAFGAMALLLASCSSEEPTTTGGNDAADGDVYATLRLMLPTGTRAGEEGEGSAGEGEETGKDKTDVIAGQEFGKDSENKVTSILVMLATKDDTGAYQYLTHSESNALPGGNIGGDHEIVNVNAGEVLYTMTFNAKDLNGNSDYEVAQDKTVYVFAFCNPTVGLTSVINNLSSGDKFAEKGLYGELSKDDVSNNNIGSIWEPNQFLMTNCEIVSVVLPVKDTLIKENNKPEKAFNLGTVHVKRAAARFDYALGGENNDNKFTIYDNIDRKKEVGSVELTEMAMFNIARYYYYLPRTNDKWDWSGTTTLCSDKDDQSNFVMSYNKDNFKQKNLVYDDYKKNYFANIINNPLAEGSTDDFDKGSQKLNWVSITADAWKNAEDTDEGWTQDPKNDYRIWRYATENTIPSIQNSNNATSTQKVGITTGVVFKAEFTPANQEVWNGNVIYLYNGAVYGDFNALKEYVTKYPETIVAKDFDKVSAFKSDKAGLDLKENLIENVGKTSSHGFKAYKAADDNSDNDIVKYTMYYYYYNRHNNNNNNFEMGKNEFGVVRNNVYKLRVTTCGSLGEPKSPEDPNTPDEEENVYFTVSCHVMPWTVRINNIEF